MRRIIGRHVLGATESLAWRRFPAAPASVQHQARRMSDLLGSGDVNGGRLRLAFAAACLPHPDKAERGGEDGYFACSRSRAFGVADGVGGWAENGVDPGEFARSLLSYAHEGIRETPREAEANLQDVLVDAHARINAMKIQGGSTALLGQLCDSTVTILNLGDSGVMLLRPATRKPPGADHQVFFPRVVFRSCDQTHYFNCPYQLASDGPSLQIPDHIRVRVRTGDLIVAATDGVFDNLFDHQLQALVAHHLGKAWSTGQNIEPHLKGLASAIVRQAQRIGRQENKKDTVTPFALAAYSEGLKFSGGKLDDTTVVLGLVCSQDDEAENSLKAKTDEPPEFNNFNS